MNIKNKEGVVSLKKIALAVLIKLLKDQKKTTYNPKIIKMVFSKRRKEIEKVFLKEEISDKELSEQLKNALHELEYEDLILLTYFPERDRYHIMREERKEEWDKLAKKLPMDQINLIEELTEDIEEKIKEGF